MFPPPQIVNASVNFVSATGVSPYSGVYAGISPYSGVYAGISPYSGVYVLYLLTVAYTYYISLQWRIRTLDGTCLFHSWNVGEQE
jgi:hypothetical protein